MTKVRVDGSLPRGGRREALLRAAAVLFAERGFHGVGVDDIGAAAGISGPGVYRHFASKDAMLAEMLVRISDELLDGGTKRVAGSTDPRGALDALVRGHVDFALSNPELITVHDHELSRLPEADRRMVRRSQRQYVETWVSVIRAVWPDRDETSARGAAHAAFGLMNSTPHSARRGGTGLDSDAMAEMLRRMTLAALGAAGTQADAVPVADPRSP